MPESDPPHREQGPLGIEWLSGGARTAGLLGFVVFLLVSGAILALDNGRFFRAPMRQPIAFNHKKHVKDLGLDCTTCHAFYEKQTFSGLPTAEVCSQCHGEAQGKSEEEAKLVRLLGSGAPLLWKPLFRQPPHVFYSHRRHVVGAKIECKVCHGMIAESETPPTAVNPLRMGDCLACHGKSGVSTDCTACHR